MADVNTSTKTATSILFSKLIKTNNIERFIEMYDDNMKLPALHTYITQKCNEAGEVVERIATRAGIESSYAHQIFKGSRTPSREKVIQLAFGFGFTIEETQRLLQVAQYSLLYPRIKRDAIIIFCINNKKSMIETQALLHELGLNLLGGERE